VHERLAPRAELRRVQGKGKQPHAAVDVIAHAARRDDAVWKLKRRHNERLSDRSWSKEKRQAHRSRSSEATAICCHAGVERSPTPPIESLKVRITGH
jgi:hypothetical protein